MVGLTDPFMQEAASRSRLDEIRRDSTARLQGFGSPGLGALAPVPEPQAPQARLLFNPVTKEMAAGGRKFRQDDIQSVLSAPQFMDSPVGPDPDGPEWTVLTPQDYQGYVQSLSERRGTGELLGRGVKNIAYGLGTLPGTVASLAGYEETGAALRAPVEALLGDDQNEQMRSALIAENSTLFQQVIDAGIESIPILLSSVAGGGLAASAAARAGATAGRVRAAGMAGTAGANFPLHLAGMYDAAVRNEADLTSPETKVLILGGAMANSALDFLGIESRLLSPVVQRAMGEAAENTVRRRLVSGLGAGLTEGVAEVLQTGVETLMFDPTVRDNMLPQDWKTLAPYIAERYGNAYAVSFLTGMGLGTIAGTILPPGMAVRPGATKPPVDPTQPKDLTSTATEQATEQTRALPAPVAPLGLPAPAGMSAPLSLPYDPDAGIVGAIPVAPGPGQTAPGPEASIPLTPEEMAPSPSPSDRRTTPEPPLPAEETFSNVEPAAPIRTARTDLPVGAARLRSRPSERLETYAPSAPAVAPAPDTALGEQLLRALRQRQQATPQPDMTETAPALQPAAEPTAPMDMGEVTPREYDDAYATWELVKADQPNPDSIPTLARLNKKAQREWVDAVRTGAYLRPDGLPDADLFGSLVKRKAVKSSPLVETGVTRSGPDTMRQGEELLRRQTEATRARTELERATSVGAENLRRLSTRLERVQPIPAPMMPEGVLGTASGKPFKTKSAANLARAAVAKRENVDVEVLTPVEVPGGWGLQINPLPGPPAPAPGGTKDAAIRKPRTPKAEAPKKAKLTPKAEAPKSEATPAPEPDPGVQTPEQTPAEQKAARDSNKTAASLAAGNPDVVALGRMISDINSGAKLQPGWTAEFKRLAEAVRKINAQGPIKFGQANLLDYAKPDGSPNTVSGKDGKRRIEPTSGRNALADFNTIDGAVDLDGKPVLPLAAGRVELLVRNYARKLQRAPTITVARNQADLKTKNPELYRKAKAARADGDFDTANALGYSFGDGQVIVFTDRIGSEQQLNFVLAHESIGHYGLRAIVPADKFNATMDAVYKSDPLVAARVDMAVEVRGMSRAEATEEYLADYAAVLDMSVLRRVAAAMKNGLNALGFRFSDDMVRHLVRTARRYTRNGKQDNLFTTDGLFRDIHSIESGVDPLDTGRFKEGFKSDNLRTDLLTRDVFGAAPRSMEEAMDIVKETSTRLSDKTETFVNKFFSLTMFRAQENPGLAALVRIVMRAGEISASVRNRADETLRWALNRDVYIPGTKIKVMGNISATEQVAAGYLMYTQQDNIRGGVDAKVDATLKKLRDAGKPTRMYSIVGEDVVPNDAAIKAYRTAGRLSLAEAKAILGKDKRYKAIADGLTKDSPTWKAYEAGRDAFEETELSFVEAQYKALLEDRNNAQLSMLDMLADPGPGKEKELLPQERAMFNTWAELYYALYADGAITAESNSLATDRGRRTADAFSKAVNEVILAKGFDTQKEQAVRDFFAGKKTDEFIAQLVAFRKRISLNDDNRFAAQNKIAEFAAAEMSYTSAETSARNLLVQGYTPIVRKEDRYQIRVNAFDAKTGEFLQMDSEHKGMAVYRTAGSLEEVTKLAGDMNLTFGDTANVDAAAKDVQIVTVDGKPVRTYTMKVRGKGEIDFKERQVIIRAEPSAAVRGISTPLNLNINEFLRGLRQYGLNVMPDKLEQIIVDMTAQDARARKRLEQTGNPGYQVEGGVTALEAIAQHIDGRASLVSKIQMRPLIDRLMNVKLTESRKLWFGDQDRLKELKAAYDKAMVDPNMNEAARFLAKSEYTDYAAKMKNTITTRNGMEVNLGNKYLSDGMDLMAFVNGNRDVNESDWGAGPVASWMRRWISSVQLGGTLAQPIMNNIGPFTNFIPWLGSFNQNTGFGGGAGIKAAYAQYLRAMSDVGGGGGVSFTKRAAEMHTAEYWDQVATGLQTHPGVSQIEAEFIANETRNGVLTPAQANSLLGMSRNYTTNPAVRQALDKWMFFYLSSEQATRRASALAAFRVQMERRLTAEGKTVEQLTDAERRKFYSEASTFAADGVRYTLGEYGSLNRPAAWRSGFQSFLYMYKVWPTTSIQTLSRLDNKGKAAFLIPLLALSGLAGLPFVEDGEDVLDTILQQLGMSTGSLRLEAAKLIDGVFPGMSPFVLNGVMTNVLGADVAGRFSMGDFIPGTAAFLPGQDAAQTVREVVGPAWGFFEGIFKGGSQLAAAPFSETATFVDAMRQGPVTLARALGDAMAYTSAGAAIDKRGYVIDEELTTAMLVSRVLGFTPGSVAAQYELVRLAKRETNYQKQVVAKFRTGLLKAELSGDRETAASIRRTVKEWNEATKGTLLEIRNFEKNYQRLKQQATMSAKERFLKSAGKQNQEAVEFIGELVMYD